MRPRMTLRPTRTWRPRDLVRPNYSTTLPGSPQDSTPPYGQGVLKQAGIPKQF